MSAEEQAAWAAANPALYARLLAFLLWLGKGASTPPQVPSRQQQLASIPANVPAPPRVA
jgi:hypothetical protein